MAITGSVAVENARLKD